MEDNSQSGFITFRDHCCVVAECKRLLEELKSQYEKSHRRLNDKNQELTREMERTKSERNILQQKLSTLTSRLQDNEERLIRAEKKLCTTLKCLEQLVGYTENLGRKFIADKAERDKVLREDWNNHLNDEMRRISRAQRNKFQVREKIERHKHNHRSSMKLKRIRARHTEKIRSLRLVVELQRQKMDKLNYKNQHLQEKLRLLFFRFQHQVLLEETRRSS